MRSVLDKQIQAAIVAQIGNSDALIATAVSFALRQKVDSSGTISKYSNDNKYDFLDILAKRAVQDAAKEAIKEWLAINSQKIKEAVLKEMKKPTRQNSIAKAFADAVESSLKCSWGMTCNISFKESTNGN